MPMLVGLRKSFIQIAPNSPRCLSLSTPIQKNQSGRQHAPSLIIHFPMDPPLTSPSCNPTIQSLIESISFHSPPANPKHPSTPKSHTTKSLSSSSISDSLMDDGVGLHQTKLWTVEENQLFYELIQKYGSDFTLMKEFLPRKSKNQLKRKYKLDVKKSRNGGKSILVKEKKGENGETGVKSGFEAKLSALMERLQQSLQQKY